MTPQEDARFVWAVEAIATALEKQLSRGAFEASVVEQLAELHVAVLRLEAALSAKTGGAT
jgi:hypothetical protein